MAQTMKNSELLALNSVLEKYMSVKQGKIAWALARNKQRVLDALKPYVELQSSRQKEIGAMLSEGGSLYEYEQARQALCKVHAVKDEKGNPATSGNTYVIANKAEFDSELADLAAGYVELLEEKVAIEKVVETAFAEEVEFEPYTLSEELAVNSDIFEARDLLQLAERGIIVESEKA